MAMKYVEPKTMSDVERTSRKALQALVNERAFYGCTLSLAALLKAGVPLAVVQKATVASNDEEKKVAQKDLNEKITAILQESGLESVRLSDAFGNPKDCGWYESKAVSFNKDRVREALLKRRMDPDDIAAVIEEATVTTPYTALAIRSVKDEVEKEEAKEARKEARSGKANTANAGNGKPVAKAAARGKR